MEKKSEQIEEKKITKHQFYFEISLYNEIKIDDLEEDIFNWDVDAYSNTLSDSTTYKINSGLSYDREYDIDNIYYWSYSYIFEWFKQITLTCKRKNEEVLTYLIYVKNNTFIKVWQYPSLADIQFWELWKKYNKILSIGDLKNYKKAIWLFSHWAWAGSFIYLRRIFENLIYKTFESHVKDLGITEENFLKLRMMEKVDFLQKYLPSRLVKMKAIYWILSKWVHELTEEECLKYFPIMKISIEVILDEKIKEEKEKQDELEITEAIAKATQQLS